MDKEGQPVNIHAYICAYEYITCSTVHLSHVLNEEALRKFLITLFDVAYMFHSKVVPIV